MSKQKSNVIPTVTLPTQAKRTTRTPVKKPAKAKVTSKKVKQDKPDKPNRMKPRAKRRLRATPETVTGAPPVGSTPPPMETAKRSRVVVKKDREHLPTAMQAEQPDYTPVESEVTPPVPPNTSAPVPVPPDPRMVQGATCTWIGRMDESIDRPEDSIPACPHCQGNLLTAQDEETIQLGLEMFELGAYQSVNPPPRPHPGYTALCKWMREQPKCWPTIEQAAEEYYRATGRLVNPSR